MCQHDRTIEQQFRTGSRQSKRRQTAWFSQDNRPDSWSKRQGLSHIAPTSTSYMD
ncbi:hypothetical protein OH76DRAFT_1401367 [Lentinus brumalis]|uniref:Uncharacterized protein n=1 Tax=Lentinus brumalis TaxID=2498619 RepID=A0A371DG53_9APHY|nr:hypothetical protein OH76DRAFT_1401367 [Polyporus brumalis]